MNTQYVPAVAASLGAPVRFAILKPLAQQANQLLLELTFGHSLDGFADGLVRGLQSRLRGVDLT